MTDTEPRGKHRSENLSENKWAASGELAVSDDFDNWLVDQLRHSEPYLEDKGFTDKVMRGLPATLIRRPVDDLLGYGIILIIAILSLAVVICNFPLLGLAIDTVVYLILLNKVALLGAGLLFAAASALMGVWALKRNIF
ncbi:MAG: hypothetical protein P8Y45_16580 [Exilibacterium sp.]